MEKMGFLEKDHISNHWIAGKGVPTIRVVGNKSKKGGEMDGSASSVEGGGPSPG
jgi:hypothetical protein